VVDVAPRSLAVAISAISAISQRNLHISPPGTNMCEFCNFPSGASNRDAQHSDFAGFFSAEAINAAVRQAQRQQQELEIVGGGGGDEDDDGT
jgi:hypothetical protein